ncbi:O-acetyl-ADP-ribose deacetylase (regulator of RNase III) [Streptacidiphilus sp. MAP5-52]
MVMGALNVVRGDATAPQGKGPKVIAHVCNDMGGWGKGFVVALSKRWPEPEAAYQRWHRERAKNDFGLGAVQLVRVGLGADRAAEPERDQGREREQGSGGRPGVAPGLWVANMIGQHGTRRGGRGLPPVRYEAIGTALSALAPLVLERGASVHMPRIGCGLAGGRWERVEPLVRDVLVSRGVSVTVYDHG